MSLSVYIDFAAAAELDKDVSPWKEARRTGKIYGTFAITKAAGFWTDKFVGIEFFGEIQFTKNEKNLRQITRVIPVRLCGRHTIRGRPIPAEAVNMI